MGGSPPNSVPRMVSAAASVATGLVAFAMATIAAYLLVLSAAAARAPRTPQPGRLERRFAILVPAHDEASVIQRLLESVAVQTYPQRLIDVFVVADNCTDDTAELARTHGAIVYERTDEELRAKGHALRWLIERVRGDADAYVVLDADSVIEPRFISFMDARLDAGSLIVQAHYQVLNADASSLSALRAAALASLHYLRPLGRSALGLSSGLKGNGMCFDARTLERHGWTSAGLAEDVELHLSLVSEGLRVEFAPEAVVRADMPTTYTEARSQNLRWETGRLAALRRDVLPLMRLGFIRRDPVAIDAAIEQVIPPLSVGLSVAVGCAAIGFALGDRIVTGLAVFAAAGFLAHVVAGLVATRAPARSYRALAAAPAYVLWKLALYARALVGRADGPWVRTQRSTASHRQGGGAG
jgi:cellulose synthase/poly-beta-1,6-N-acetylglucosamine synthase-like glycosyltransferase